jgi:hypothetical protein
VITGGAGTFRPPIRLTPGNRRDRRFLICGKPLMILRTCQLWFCADAGAASGVEFEADGDDEDAALAISAALW